MGVPSPSDVRERSDRTQLDVPAYESDIDEKNARGFPFDEFEHTREHRPHWPDERADPGDGGWRDTDDSRDGRDALRGRGALSGETTVRIGYAADSPVDDRGEPRQSRQDGTEGEESPRETTGRPLGRGQRIEGADTNPRRREPEFWSGPKDQSYDRQDVIDGADYVRDRVRSAGRERRGPVEETYRSRYDQDIRTNRYREERGYEGGDHRPGKTEDSRGVNPRLGLGGSATAEERERRRVSADRERADLGRAADARAARSGSRERDGLFEDVPRSTDWVRGPTQPEGAKDTKRSTSPSLARHDTWARRVWAGARRAVPILSIAAVAFATGWFVSARRVPPAPRAAPTVVTHRDDAPANVESRRESAPNCRAMRASEWDFVRTTRVSALRLQRPEAPSLDASQSLVDFARGGRAGSAHVIALGQTDCTACMEEMPSLGWEARAHPEVRIVEVLFENEWDGHDAPYLRGNGPRLARSELPVAVANAPATQALIDAVANLSFPAFIYVSASGEAERICFGAITVTSTEGRTLRSWLNRAVVRVL